MKFEDFLSERKGVPLGKVQFYLQWVSMFREYTVTYPGSSRKEFIGSIINRFDSWQIRQVESAITFYEQYTNSFKCPESFDKLLVISRDKMRYQHLAYNTEKTYLYWIEKFFNYTRLKPEDITEVHIKEYLSYIAVKKSVAVATQSQAFNALLFMCRYILNIEIKELNSVVRSHNRRKLPVVLTKDEILHILSYIEGKKLLILQLIYGAGLRLNEALSLRVKDINVDEMTITIRSGKGNKDRFSLLPISLKSNILKQIEFARNIYLDDRKQHIEGVELPDALERKYTSAGKEWQWFWLFPSVKLAIDPRTNIVRRYHLYPSTIQKTFKRALNKTYITKRASVHTLRHSFATHLVEAGYDIRTIQELLGHSNVNTTMIYTHVAQKNKLSVISPADSLFGS